MLRHITFAACLMTAFAMTPRVEADVELQSGNTITQSADTVIGASSDEGSPSMPNQIWTAQRALGAADVYPAYSTSGTNQWVPGIPNYAYPSSDPATHTAQVTQTITLGYDQAVYADSVSIFETLGLIENDTENGFVYQVDLVDTNNVYHTVYSGTATENIYFSFGVGLNNPGVNYATTGNVFTVTFTETDYQVQGVKVYVNINHAASYEGIDAIYLSGSTVSAVPLPSSFGLLATAFPGWCWFASRRRKTAA